MPQHLFLTAVLVRDYDEAIDFYVNKLGFEIRLDKPSIARQTMGGAGAAG